MLISSMSVYTLREKKRNIEPKVKKCFIYSNNYKKTEHDI